MSKPLVFLHTSPAHVATFDALLAEVAPDVTARHLVDEDVLRQARDGGRLTAEMQQQVSRDIHELTDGGAAVILCTCSTIGGCAESYTGTQGSTILRVDRPMARRAVELGRRIILAATLASTLQPTAELIRDEAARAGKEIELIEVLCNGAWAKFEQGDREGYFAAIAEALREPAQQADVIVLAQASMAGVEPVAADAGIRIPVLSSPRLGLEAALAVLRQSQHSQEKSMDQSPITPADIEADPSIISEAVELPGGEQALLRPLTRNDAGMLGRYFLSLSDDTKRRYGPHPFDQATADQLCAETNYADTVRMLMTTGSGSDEQVIAYFILVLGVWDADRERYATLNMPLSAATDCTLAPSVADAYQSRGVGNIIMQQVIATARRLGKTRMVLWGGVQATNARAKNFYTKYGFQHVGDFESPPGRNNHDMIMALA